MNLERCLITDLSHQPLVESPEHSFTISQNHIVILQHQLVQLIFTAL